MQPRVPVVGSIQKESTQKKCTATVRLKHFLHQRRKKLQASPFHLFPACSELVQRNLVITFLNKLAGIIRFETTFFAHKMFLCWNRLAMHRHYRSDRLYETNFCYTRQKIAINRVFASLAVGPVDAEGIANRPMEAAAYICWEECEASGKYKRNKYQTNLHVCHSSHACP